MPRFRRSRLTFATISSKNSAICFWFKAVRYNYDLRFKYRKGLKIKLLDNKPYTYELLETSYKNCDYKNKESWIAFKKFLKNLLKKYLKQTLQSLQVKD